jgi:hypothetical protein
MRNDDGATGLHVVVTCTNRKSRAVPSELSVRSLPGSVEDRVAEWVERLSKPADLEVVPARELYAGEHWQVVLALEASVEQVGPPARVWVCSAGYGLIDLDAGLRPYSATFATGQPDSVAPDGPGRRRWWEAITNWAGPDPGQPRTFRALAETHPRASILVAASAAYLTACRDDLIGAAKALEAPTHLSVICAGQRHAGPLAEHLVPADARLQPVLGGTRQALNIRLLTRLLTSPQCGLLTTDALSAMASALLAEAPPIVRYGRIPSTDYDVRTFIRARLRVEPTLSKTRLLREYRDDGRACEQSRFAQLYDHVQEDLDDLND